MSYMGEYVDNYVLDANALVRKVIYPVCRAPFGKAPFFGRGLVLMEVKKLSQKDLFSDFHSEDTV